MIPEQNNHIRRRLLILTDRLGAHSDMDNIVRCADVNPDDGAMVSKEVMMS